MENGNIHSSGEKYPSSLPYQRASRGGRSRRSATARSVARSEGLPEFHSALGSTWIAIRQTQSTQKTTLVNDIFIQFFLMCC